MSRQIHKVLIANRGEIAARIARAAREAGIETVGVYADSDFDAGFLDGMDEAYALFGETPGDTYLNMEKLLSIAVRAGADAVHPGYGFLSESAPFAQKVEELGLTWIGPSSSVISSLGDKISAREIARRVNAPMTPSSDGFVTTTEEVTAFSAEHGYPVVVKAAYGGGGRGLRVVRHADEAESQLRSAQHEAQNAFGRDECFVEVFLDQPRHIETQVLGDTKGNIAVVGTRDCSLQRRNQKVIEEAPAPFLDESIEQEIRDASKRIFAEVGYVGAGTVEFLVSAAGIPTFLEVNTRLQVEHPVTEEAYGVDLVREQFRIASGEALSIADDLQPSGHSIEFRLNAESVANNFLPSQGMVSVWEPPAGAGVRLDSDTQIGTIVGGSFDSLLGKLIVSGATREEAFARAQEALARFEVRGVETLLPFHRSVMTHQDFSGGNDAFSIHTNWIEQSWDSAGVEAAAEQETEFTVPHLQEVKMEVDGKLTRMRVSTRQTAVLPGISAQPRRPRPIPKSRNRAGSQGGEVVAPMQGSVLSVAVSIGDTVEAGDIVAVLEAMKMELPVKATQSGTVEAVSVAEGQAVGASEILAVIQAEDAS